MRSGWKCCCHLYFGFTKPPAQLFLFSPLLPPLDGHRWPSAGPWEAHRRRRIPTVRESWALEWLHGEEPHHLFMLDCDWKINLLCVKPLSFVVTCCTNFPILANTIILPIFQMRKNEDCRDDGWSEVWFNVVLLADSLSSLLLMSPWSSWLLQFQFSFQHTLLKFPLLAQESFDFTDGLSLGYLHPWICLCG